MEMHEISVLKARGITSTIDLFNRKSVSRLLVFIINICKII